MLPAELFSLVNQRLQAVIKTQLPLALPANCLPAYPDSPVK